MGLQLIQSGREADDFYFGAHRGRLEHGSAQRAARPTAGDRPASRILGNLLIAGLVLVHDRFILHDVSWARFLLLLGVLGGYALLLSCLARFGVFERFARIDFNLMALIGDTCVWTFAIYASGGDRSWLFPLLLVRLVDQTPKGFKQVLILAHVAGLSYAAMLLWLGLVEQRDLQWGAAAAKLGLVCGASLYLVFAARAAEALRSRSVSAVHMARSLIGELEEKSRALEQSRARAEAASRAKSTFLANMGHELRTPLNAILGYTDLLREDAATLGHGDLVPDLDKINAAGRHLLAIVEDVLDLAKIEAGKMDLHPQTFDLASFVRDVAAGAAPEVRKNGNVLEVRCPEGIGSMHADRQRVRQMLMSLLSNAAKFTEAGRVVLDVSRQNGASGGWVAVRVEDTGIGMAPAELDRLFRPFVQADSSPTRRHGGAGLGLVVAQRLCNMMGGDVFVDSEPGKGSTFTVRIPTGESSGALAAQA